MAKLLLLSMHLEQSLPEVKLLDKVLYMAEHRLMWFVYSVMKFDTEVTSICTVEN